MPTHWSDSLALLRPCAEALEWMRTQPTPEVAWAACERGDWLLWISAHLCPRPLVVLAACDVAEAALEHTDDADVWMASLWCLHIAREWVEGRADVEDVRVGRSCAYAAAADAAAAAAAADADAAAAYAAYAADAAAAYAYAAAAAAAAADADAAAYAAYAAACRRASRARSASIVRARIPCPSIPERRAA